MNTKLNDTYVGRLKHKAERYDARDSVERGLMMRVGKKVGHKQWYTFVYRGSKRQMVRLGSFPKMNTQEARIAAIAAKNASNTARPSEHIITVADLFKEYRAAIEPSRRSWRDVQIAWDTWARDRIGHVRLQDLTVHHGREMRNHITSNSTELRANSVIRYIRPMFAWAEEEEHLDVNPWVTLKSKVVATPRDRVLSNDEWQSLWTACSHDRLGPFVRFLMLSAQRVGNVSSMRWDELDGNVWTIPREKFKATKVSAQKAHEVPMSRAMLAIVNAQPRLGPFVFGITGQRPLSFGSRQKDRFGKLADLSDWVVHDIRRTAATRMGEGKVTRFIIERVLGHADNTVTGRYDHAIYRDEKRDALEVVAASLLGRTDGVVNLYG